jgi:hypothetical protein
MSGWLGGTAHQIQAFKPNAATPDLHSALIDLHVGADHA